jgi:glyoxylate reductase
MKYKVFVTRTIPGDAIKQLKKHFIVKVYPKDQKIPRKELIKGVKWCDALLCILTEKIDKEIIDINPNLKVISNYAVGYNNIDVAYATKKGIPVCNTPSMEVVDSVAEHALTLLLAIAKRIHEDEVFVRKHKWKSWAPRLLLGSLIKNKTIGIIGLGRIGKGVAERAGHGLGMNVIYYDVRKDAKFEKKYKAKKVSLTTLLKKSDFVTLHVNLSKKTHHLIGKKELSLMKKTAYIINTSRGPVIDEKALTSALKNKRIAGAGLDVHETEPSVNHTLHKLNNCILTPHIASATVEVRQKMGEDAKNNIIAILKKKGKPKIVNPEVLKK